MAVSTRQLCSTFGNELTERLWALGFPQNANNMTRFAELSQDYGKTLVTLTSTMAYHLALMDKHFPFSIWFPQKQATQEQNIQHLPRCSLNFCPQIVPDEISISFLINCIVLTVWNQTFKVTKNLFFVNYLLIIFNIASFSVEVDDYSSDPPDPYST